MAEPNGNVVGTGYDQTLKRVLTRKDLIIYGIAFMTPIAPAYIYDGGDAFHRDELR